MFKKACFLIGALSLTSTSLVTAASSAMAQSDTKKTLKKIVIKGNQRVESETILSYLPMKEGEEIDGEKQNSSLKALFNTGYFSDIKVSEKDGVLLIQVKENPVINKVAFEGNSKVSDDIIKEEISLNPREVLSPAKIQEAKQKILAIYCAKAFFGAKVEPKIIERSDNRVDVVFEIQENSPAYIIGIKFVGNKAFDESDLRAEMVSKEYRWYRFMSSSDVYNPEVAQADVQALLAFYNDQGYADCKIEPAVAELTPNKDGFFLTYKITEGKKYTIKKVQVKSDVKSLDTKALSDELFVDAGDVYKISDIDKSVASLVNELGSQGKPFLGVKQQLDKNKNNGTIDLTFNISPGPRIYVERIVIVGNDRTYDEVIRRELLLHEGDAFNQSKIKVSEQKLRALGFFKNVSISIDRGSAPDKKVLVIKVEEQETGTIRLSLGYSTTDGPLINAGITERNFRGKGQTVHFDVNVAKKHQSLDVGFIEPRLFDRELEGSIDVYGNRSLRDKKYKELSFGSNLGISYKLSRHITQSWIYMPKVDKINLDKTEDTTQQPPNQAQQISPIIKAQAVNTFSSALAHNISYNNFIKKPFNAGYSVGLRTTFAGIGGNVHFLRNELSGSFRFAIADSVICTISGSYGFMNKTKSDRDIRVVDSFSLGSNTLRGFEYKGVGPMDGVTKDSLGGTRRWISSAEVTFPLGLPKELGIRGAVFFDMGSLWNPGKSDANTVSTESKTRMSVGFGVSWASPFGPLRIDYAIPIKKEKTDKEERILVGFETGFKA